MANSLSEIFNEFAGKEVQVVESRQNFNIGGKDYLVTDVFPAANDPTLDALKKAVNDKGMSLRVWFPGMMGTMDYRTDRVNANVDKGADGKYRVSGGFSIG